MASSEILLTGATGQIGGCAARELVARGHRPRALVRPNTERARAVPEGVQPVAGDLADRASLARALEGVDALLVVSPAQPEQCELEGNLVRAAAQAGKPLVVKISGLATAPDSFVRSGRWHAETEALVRARELPFVFLRPYFLMQNLGMQLASARDAGTIRTGAGAARIAMVDVEDVGAVAARLLAGEVDRSGEALDLTGAEALSFDDVAARMGAAFDRTVACRRDEAEAVRALLRGIGLPEWRVENLLEFDRAFREGLGEKTTPHVASVLGRAPRSLDDYLADA